MDLSFCLFINYDITDIFVFFVRMILTMFKNIMIELHWLLITVFFIIPVIPVLTMTTIIVSVLIISLLYMLSLLLWSLHYDHLCYRYHWYYFRTDTHTYAQMDTSSSPSPPPQRRHTPKYLPLLRIDTPDLPHLYILPPPLPAEYTHAPPPPKHTCTNTGTPPQSLCIYCLP